MPSDAERTKTTPHIEKIRIRFDDETRETKILTWFSRIFLQISIEYVLDHKLHSDNGGEKPSQRVEQNSATADAG